MKHISAALTLLVGEDGLQVTCVNHELNLTTETTETDLADFTKLVPSQHTISKFVEYLFTSDDFSGSLNYIHGEEYASLVTEVRDSPEYAALIDFLKNSELDDLTAIDEEIQRVRSAGYSETTLDNASDYTKFVKDIKELLPIEEIKKLQDEKMSLNGDYATFVRRLHTEEFGQLFVKFFTAPTTLEWIEKSFEHGVDIPSDVEYAFNLYGVNLNS